MHEYMVSQTAFYKLMALGGAIGVLISATLLSGVLGHTGLAVAMGILACVVLIAMRYVVVRDRAEFIERKRRIALIEKNIEQMDRATRDNHRRQKLMNQNPMLRDEFEEPGEWKPYQVLGNLSERCGEEVLYDPENVWETNA